jgi:Glutamate synthase domain 2
MISTIRGYRRINLIRNPSQKQNTIRCLSSNDPKDGGDKDDIWTNARVSSYVGHTFPDFIEGWNRRVYRKVGYGLAATSTLAAGLTATICDSVLSTSSIPAALLTAGTAAYFYVGERDIKQKQHSVRRNYPVIGNLRYVLETIRPELRQYFVESDMDGRPFDRMHRVQIYQRAKNVDDTLPFGTRRNLYDINSEWACHSMWPKTISLDKARHTIGSSEWGCKLPYSSSIFNISAMSYGAISENAILSLNNGAKFGNFSHNTGEGGVSKFHRRHGGDLVWNIGTGYYGCGTGGEHRVFDQACFQDSLAEAEGQIKMIEIKLSQGAKPGHGGLLPRSKITKEIANARKLQYPPEFDCHSPSSHSAFSSPTELVEFLAHVRELSGGLPVGIKNVRWKAGGVCCIG